MSDESPETPDSNGGDDDGSSAAKIALYAIVGIFILGFLAVATVIGAAVIGSFVLDLGETAPPYADATVSVAGDEATVELHAIGDADHIVIEGGEFNGQRLNEVGATHTAVHNDEEIRVIAVRGDEEAVVEVYSPR